MLFYVAVTPHRHRHKNRNGHYFSRIGDKPTVSQTSGDGVLHIDSATENTQLSPENYLYFYTDIYGKSHSEREMDATSHAALKEHYAYLIQGISAIIQQTGLGITMADLGFGAMG